VESGALEAEDMVSVVGALLAWETEWDMGAGICSLTGNPRGR